MSDFRQWAKSRGIEDVYDRYLEEKQALSNQCEAEGYPSHGSNYELRLEALQEEYPELFDDNYWDDECLDDECLDSDCLDNDLSGG